MLDTADTIAKKGRWAKKNGILTATNETKAALTAEEVQHAMQWLTLAMDGKADVPEFMNLMQAAGKLASENPDEVDIALRQLSRHGGWDYWMTESGQTASWILKEATNLDPEVSAKMLKEVAEATTDVEKIGVLLTHSYNFTADTAKKMFPTLDEQIKAKEKVGRGMKAANAVHKQAEKFYGPMRRLFSEMYLGKTPGYAVRNMVQNFGQTIYDLGINSMGGIYYVDDLFDWAGLQKAVDAGDTFALQQLDKYFVGMQRSIGHVDIGTRGEAAARKAKQAGGNARYFDMRYWSGEVFEKWGGEIIFRDQYPKNVKKALTGTTRRVFEDMNIDKATARQLKPRLVFIVLFPLLDSMKCCEKKLIA
jgi:hypothetical protein